MYTEMSLQCSFEGVGGLNVQDVRREGLPLLWSMVRERALARGFHFKIGMRIKCLCVCVSLEAKFISIFASPQGGMEVADGAAGEQLEDEVDTPDFDLDAAAAAIPDDFLKNVRITL